MSELRVGRPDSDRGRVMRIIAGQRRGHKFDGPRAGGTRPTSDLVRESIFNILNEAVDGLTVVDLFAGTGALGLEALSRGARDAVFVERNRNNVGLIHRNLATLRFEDRGRVVAADAYRWARGFEPEGEPLVVLVDPPYRDYEMQGGRKVRQMLRDLVDRLPDGSTLAVESSQHLDETILPDAPAWDVRRYGGTLVAFRTIDRAGEPAGPRESSDFGDDEDPADPDEGEGDSGDDDD